MAPTRVDAAEHHNCSRSQSSRRRRKRPAVHGRSGRRALARAGRFLLTSARTHKEDSMKKLYAIAIAASTALLGAQSPSRSMVEWPHWGGDAAQNKYYTASDITPANVRHLELA